MLTLRLAQHPILTQNQPTSWRSWSHCQPTRWQLRMSMNLQHAWTALATRYPTSQPTLTIFLKWTWIAPFKLASAKNFDIPRPFEALRHDIHSGTPNYPLTTVPSSTCRQWGSAFSYSQRP